jgi:hypothetical protein
MISRPTKVVEKKTAEISPWFHEVRALEDGLAHSVCATTGRFSQLAHAVEASRVPALCYDLAVWFSHPTYMPAR